MAKVTSVTIDEQMSHGRYESTSAMVAAGLQLLRDQAEIEAIRTAIADGEASGEPETFDFDSFIEKKRAARAQR